ncbi:MAG TPA: 1-(5-phosphoribosyl)-5-[(5-phosphoribosylamino)methylideneamino]imidazole-4-carboxamide isomerase [Syntrophomonadaceae bacterium]|nr:1-(5-phosphoribosyl)-5-[(5-phosphoribosylamino)methylideneamino]imidazole-4-carboxamide isomerase [Syntrophomonadaceae bacterium]
MIIFPAIDLKEGQCVRLVQGRREDKTVYSNSPGEMARSFEQQGAQYLHVVDLDGAFEGEPRNLQAIAEIAAAIKIPFQVGGGLRTRADVARLLELGASRVIIGTRAVHNPLFMQELLEEYGSERILLGIDAHDGMVAMEGWLEKSTLDAFKFGQTMGHLGVKTAVYTDIARDGLLQGPNLPAIEQMVRSSGLNIIASGGVSTVENITALKELEPQGLVGAIVGKALYEGKISLADALAAAR